MGSHGAYDRGTTGVVPQQHDPAREIWLLQCELAETRSALRSARVEMGRMLNSRSWRATSVLRNCLDLARKAFRREHASTWHLGLQPAGTLFDPPQRGREALLLVDVTELAICNLQGGIQHVVKGILSEWLFAAPSGWSIVPVRLAAEGFYVSAARDLGHVLGEFEERFPACRIPVRSGDAFLGLDLLRDPSTAFRQGLSDLKRRGVHIQIVVYDLLPLDLPTCAPPGISSAFAKWLEVVGEFADGVSCISNTVARRFSEWLGGRAVSSRPPTVAAFPLGVAGPRHRAKQTKSTRQGTLSLLLVGTIEPRKAYVDALDAVESIWRSSPDAGLTVTVVGRYGWGVPDVLARLSPHADGHGRLRWLGSATDDDVELCYGQADALLFSSHGEGFGLPVIEAARHGLPLILRDLPEFREVAGDAAYYFSGGADEITDVLRAWMADSNAGRARKSTTALTTTWSESAARAMASIEESMSYKSAQCENQGGPRG